MNSTKTAVGGGSRAISIQGSNIWHTCSFFLWFISFIFYLVVTIAISWPCIVKALGCAWPLSS